MSYSRRIFLTSLLAAAATPALSQSVLRPLARPARIHPALRQTPTQMLQQARLGNGVSYLAARLSDGQVIEGNNPGMALAPASTAKAVTALYALDRLGADFRFETLVLGQGVVEAGTLQGTLMLAGGGDPILSTPDLVAMVDQLHAAGVRRVNGTFSYFDGALPAITEIDPGGQLPQAGYNPAISGLNLNFNRVHFEWTRAGGAWNLAMDARGGNVTPAVSIATMALADRGAPTFSYRQDGVIDRWTVASGALGNGGSRWLPVRSPGAYAADVFRTLCAARGITLPTPQPEGRLIAGNVYARHQSPELLIMLRDMLEYSTNITAEVIGLTAARRDNPGVVSLPQSAAAMAEWVLLQHGAQMRLVDHSGLGGAAQIAPDQMVRLLRGGADGPLRGILRPVVLTDAEGDRLPNPDTQVAAKTGTLNFTSALVGYIDPPAGEDLVFAIFSSDPAARQAARLDEVPAGSRAWNARARRLQQQLIQRWGALYSTM
ncbi:D-alanyl-D-alanine carboxypeptidase/D-alanyl-D-alanine endopeptidase [Ketogulonicigenium vulgare]|uniref:D-alanyl-D-alanine carboxypeptidase/D-alanyl-D-alanine endopeptidase n=1 Tax=Ketogulonicigenium vulgare TaxID=92945 RepID=UPI0001E677C1|nr:D-alanyl-D-alanine carboxypeptidase/D-alanyl-D-alanine-endopeptidase [Ketogulonicigenium vulgare]ADO42019.1 D-alanyl-D-alanine carboxypeptidase/D-alanyl-D-alanine-endopeptidase [Ketogulonicigenium vulgare Y25]ALJ80439.1 hypothetical protein KVH_04150 [Ketogulonicigenium vulgare]AOZ53944.1 D-alanyl-D-alanine carboxypeptidase/D-alanyl-D-alanine-endopeptidase [Ketogulonicigenium vulgare]